MLDFANPLCNAHYADLIQKVKTLLLNILLLACVNDETPALGKKYREDLEEINITGADVQEMDTGPQRLEASVLSLVEEDLDLALTTIDFLQDQEKETDLLQSKAMVADLCRPRSLTKALGSIDNNSHPVNAAPSREQTTEVLQTTRLSLSGLATLRHDLRTIVQLATAIFSGKKSVLNTHTSQSPASRVRAHTSFL